MACAWLRWIGPWAIALPGVQITHKALLGLIAAVAVNAAQAESIDALSASPAHVKLLLESDQVRVLEYTLQPGDCDLWHTHPPKLSYVVEGGQLRITTADGRSFLAAEASGSANWKDAIGLHYVENVGDAVVRVVLVEVKSAVAGE